MLGPHGLRHVHVRKTCVRLDLSSSYRQALDDSMMVAIDGWEEPEEARESGGEVDDDVVDRDLLDFGL